MKRSDWLGCFGEAWDDVIDFALPRVWRDRWKDAAPADPSMVALSLPIVGLLVGLALLIFWKICGSVFTESGAALMFAFAATVFWDVKDSGRGLSLVVTSIYQISRGIRPGAFLPQLYLPRINDITGTVPVAALVMVELFKVCGFYLLATHHSAEWIVGIVVLDFTVQGFLMNLPNLQTGKKFLAVVPERQYWIWGTAIFFLLFVALRMPLAVLVGVGTAFVWAVMYKNAADELYGGITAEMITLAGYAAGLVMLLVGLLFS